MVPYWPKKCIYLYLRKYNNAEAHGFSLLYHRLRSEDGGLDTKFDTQKPDFLGILGTSFPEPYLAMKAAEHQT